MLSLNGNDEILRDTLELSSGVYAELLADMRRGFRARRIVAMERQAKIARIMQEDERVHLNGGLGEQRHCIDPDLYWDIIAQFGPDAWRNPATLRKVQAAMPEVKMPCHARNLSLRVNGLRIQPASATPSGGTPEPR